MKTGREGDDRRRDGWMVSLIQWTWVWASSGRWWRTRQPGVLQSMESQKSDTTEQLNGNKVSVFHISIGYSESSVGKESACNPGDPGSIPGSGRSSGERIGYPLQYSWASLWLSWYRICLQCGRLGVDPWVRKIPWRRERLPTAEFWPRIFHGLYSPWDCKESDMTEGLSFSLHWVQRSSVLWWGPNGSCIQSERKVCLCSAHNTADSRLMSLSLTGTQERPARQHCTQPFHVAWGFTELSPVFQKVRNRSFQAS